MALCLKLFSVVLFIVSSCSAAVKFPTEVPKCKKGDSDCIVASANKMLKLFGEGGNSGINLLPLDPLEVPRIYIKQGAESPVNVELIFTNNNLTGLKDFTFYKVNGFGENPEGKYELGFKGPIVKLLGPYSVSGKVLILPIQGVGQSNFTLLDPDMTVRFKGTTYTKNNKVYLKPENTKLTFTLSKMIMYLGNLYKGDKLLGDSTNLFLNENWEEVWVEIRKSVFDAFSLIVQNVLTTMFAKVPYDELFTTA